MTLRRMQESKYFSICIDESTDISDVNQLIIYVKTVDENFDTKVDLLSVVSMHGHVTGNILYNAVYSKDTFPLFHYIIHQQALFAKCLNRTNAMQFCKNYK